jgi:hypothetical protein
MSKNIKNILLYAIIVFSILYIVYIIIYDNSCRIDSIYGYYEANPDFLEEAELSSMALLMSDKPKLILEKEEDEIEEIIFSIDNKISYRKKNIILLECKTESDIENPITNNIVEIIYNINTGELSIFEKKNRILLANMIKDNLISLYL